MISAAQIRAARALLNWGQDRLSERSGVSVTTIRNIESEKTEPHRATLLAIERAVEDAGVRFTARGVELLNRAGPELEPEDDEGPSFSGPSL